MDDAKLDKLTTNLQTLHKMASAWVMTAVGIIGTIWFSLPPEQQKLLIEHSFLPPWSYPIALTVLGIFARVWPQKNITPPEAAAKSEQE